jgi:polysaccharide biosynthesis protein PslG
VSLAGCADDEPKAQEPKAEASGSESPSPTGEGIAPTYFGVHDHEPLGDGGAGWPDAPVGSLRAWDAGVTWRDIEIADGQYNFDRLDAIVDAAEKKDADVLLVLGQTPAFHAKDPAAESFYGPGAASPPRLAAWTAYVREVAERYAGRPVILQVWNEANVDGFWSGSPVEMAKLTKATFDAIADVSPRPTLVSPALVTRLPSQQKWLERFYSSTVEGQSVGEFMDVVSLQLYPKAEDTPETSMEILEQMRAVLTENGVDKPIWNTEINYGLTGLAVPPAPKDEQVMNVVATYLLNAANGVERVYWYGWDQQTNVGTLLVEPDGATLTPAGKAFRTVQSWLVGSTRVTCDKDAQGTWTCVLQHPEGERTVYWNPETTASVTLPDGASTIEQVGGRSRSAEAGQQIQVGKLPVMVQAAS